MKLTKSPKRFLPRLLLEQKSYHRADTVITVYLLIRWHDKQFPGRGSDSPNVLSLIGFISSITESAVCSSNGRLSATFCQATSCLYGRTAAVSTRRLFSEDPHSLSRLQDAPWPSGETWNGRESCSGFISPLCHGKIEKTIHLNLSFLERKK